MNLFAMDQPATKVYIDPVVRHTLLEMCASRTIVIYNKNANEAGMDMNFRSEMISSGMNIRLSQRTSHDHTIPFSHETQASKLVFI